MFLHAYATYYYRHGSVGGDFLLLVFYLSQRFFLDSDWTFGVELLGMEPVNRSYSSGQALFFSALLFINGHGHVLVADWHAIDRMQSVVVRSAVDSFAVSL